jgi:hypothetical protein
MDDTGTNIHCRVCTLLPGTYGQLDMYYLVAVTYKGTVSTSINGTPVSWQGVPIWWYDGTHFV